MKLVNNTEPKPNNTQSVVFTWRILYYILYMLPTYWLVNNAVLNYYEHKYFSILVWVLFTMSYPLSIFLIQYKGVY